MKIAQGSMMFAMGYGGTLALYQILNESEERSNSSFAESIGVINLNLGEEDEMSKKIEWWDQKYK